MFHQLSLVESHASHNDARGGNPQWSADGIGVFVQKDGALVSVGIGLKCGHMVDGLLEHSSTVSVFRTNLDYNPHIGNSML